MRPFDVLTAVAAPLIRANVDTDAIAAFHARDRELRPWIYLQ